MQLIHAMKMLKMMLEARSPIGLQLSSIDLISLEHQLTSINLKILEN